MDDYPLTADHALIGGLRTAAPLATNRPIDWLYAPRIASPGIFGALLDHAEVGISVQPTLVASITQPAVPADTAIMITRFTTEAGAGEVIDLMPASTSAVATRQHTLPA